MDNTVLQMPVQAKQVIAYELHGNCYLNITNHCTLRCRFCPKFNKEWTVQDYSLRLQRDPSVNEVMHAIGDVTRYEQIVFCGLGEPTLRLDVLLAVAKQLKQQGAKIRLNTDGLVNWVNGKDMTPVFAGVIDALSVSLNTQNVSLYVQHCRPPSADTFTAVLDFVKKAKQHVNDITLTAIDGLDGVDMIECEKIAEELAVKFRRRVLDKVG